VNLRSFKDGLTRYLPAEWPVIYARIKKYVLHPRLEPAAKPASLSAEFSTHRITILTSVLVITAGVTLRTLLPREFSLAPFFVFGCVFPTLVINRRWGTMAAILCTVALSITKFFLSLAPFHIDLFLWNAAMRFIFFEFFVLAFDSVRWLAHDSSAPGGWTFPRHGQ
jgi:hypothetical protein